jgi:hypothetical protein
VARYDDDLRFAQVRVLHRVSPRVTAYRLTWADLLPRITA